MKSGTTELMKFKRLVRDLRPHFEGWPIDPVTIVSGLLERLWLTTASSAIRGDIGRYEDEEIAEQLGWYGDAKILIDALVARHWIDRHDVFRLVVHDWADHAPRHVCGNVAKLGGFAVPSSKVENSTQGQSPKEQPQGPSPTAPPYGTAPRDTPPNLTGPNPTKSNPAKPDGKGPVGKAGVFQTISKPVLEDTGKLLDWYDQAAARPKPVIQKSDHHRLMVVAAAVRALEVGENPAALFTHIVSKQDWKVITQGQEECARRRIRDFDQHSRGALPTNFLRSAT